jgi:hypothetical protein
VPIALLVIVLICCGCVRELSSLTASRVAVERSNEEARRLYQVEPFKEEDGDLRKAGGQWVWHALTSAAGKDFVATVTFDAKVAVVGVEVRMLVHPARLLPADPEQFPGSEVEPDGRSYLPEVIPE